MKYWIFVVTLFFIANTAFSEGTLTFTPEKVTTGSTLNLNYKGDERFEGLNQVKAFFYIYKSKSSYPEGYEAVLSASADNSFSGQFTVPDSAIYSMIKIYGIKADGDIIIDDNYSDYWDFIVYDKSGNTYKNAWLKAGLSYMGSLPENIDRNIDLDKAHELMLKEIKAFPDNMTAKIGITSLELDMKKITNTEYQNKIAKYLDSEFDFSNENEVRAVSRALKTLNKKDEAEQLEKKFAQENPKSELAEELVLSFLGAAGSRKEFTEIATQFLQYYPYSTNRQNVYSALISAYLQNGDYESLLKIINTLENVPAYIYSQVAWEIASNEEILKKLDKSQRLGEALRVYNIGADIINSDSIANPFGYKPQFYTPTEWENTMDQFEAMYAETGGRLYLMIDSVDIAMDYFETALDMYRENAPISLYENLINVYEQKDEHESAYDIAEMAILNSKFSETISEMHKELFEETGRDSLYEYQEYLDSISTVARERRLAELEYKKIKEGPFYGVLETLDGRFIDAEEMRGKVVVLTFWSTWCGPCQVLLPTFNKFNEAYKENPDVIIAAVNMWDYDKKKDDIISYLNELDADFMVYLDKTDLIARKIGITGLPVTVFIDKEGMIQFKELGFSNEDDYIRMADDRIELLNME